MRTNHPKRVRRVNGPSLRSQWLGKLLQEERIKAQVPQEEAGQHIQRDATTIGRMERAATTIRKGDLLLLLDLYRVSDERTREALLQLSEDAWRKGWWDGFGKYADERMFIDLPWLESRATRICDYDTSLIPGLFQTKSYAHCLILQDVGPSNDEQVQRWLDFRLRRQEVLAGEKPPKIEVIIWEPALRVEVGSAAIMREQLEHLLECAKLDSVIVRVLPLARDLQSSCRSPFMTFELPAPYPDVGYVETLAGRAFVEESDQVDRFWTAYDELQAISLPPDKSLKFIQKAAKEVT